MSNIEQLTDDRRRTLMSKLMQNGDLEELGTEFSMVIPKRMTVQFMCPTCEKDFHSRLMTKDMTGMKKYMTCPECKSKAYLDNIGAPKALTHVNLDGLDKYF